MTRTLRLLVILILISGRTANAVELRIIKVGTGDGRVVDNHKQIWCGGRCTGEYERNTAVHLTIEPDYKSTYIGWLVDERPYEGNTIILQHDTVVTVGFERKASLTQSIYWYSGDIKRQAFMVFDEVVVFFRKTEQWEDLTSLQFDSASRTIRRRFHPQAVVSARYGSYLALFQYPEIFSYEEFVNRMALLKEFRDVTQVSPVLYVDLEYPESQLILTDELFVQFPEGITPAQIHTIEQEYGLERLEAIWYVPQGYRYLVHDPLEGLRLANQLYESGVVEVAYPEMIKQYRLNEPLLRGEEQ